MCMHMHTHTHTHTHTHAHTHAHTCSKVYINQKINDLMMYVHRNFMTKIPQSHKQLQSVIYLYDMYKMT